MTNSQEIIENVLKQYEESVNKLTNRVIEEEKKHYHSEIEPFDNHAKKLKKQIEQQMKGFKDSFTNGYKLILDYAGQGKLNAPPEQFALLPSDQEGISQENKKVSIDQDFALKKPLQSTCGYSEDMMTAIYDLAVTLYEAKEFSMAFDILNFLITLNPYVCWFWQLLGRIFHAQHKYVEALYAFEVAISCNIEGLEGYQDAVKFCCSAQKYDEAQRILDYGIEVIEGSENSQDRGDLKESLKSMKAYVKKISKGKEI